MSKVTTNSVKFMKGYSIKPKQVDAETGIVKFVNIHDRDSMANQQICEAYGYRWDNSTQTCIAFKNMHGVNEEVKTGNINNGGIANTIKEASNYNHVIGYRHEVGTVCQNNSLTGQYHKVSDNIKNTSTQGSHSQAVSDTEIVRGGGDRFGKGCGSIQTSNIIMSARTTSGTQRAYPMDYTGIANAHKIDNNTLYTIDATITAVRSAASGLTVGHYRTWHIKKTLSVGADGTTTLRAINSDIKPHAIGKCNGTSLASGQGITSITKSATGVYQVTFAQATPDTNYVVVANVIESSTTRDDTKIHIRQDSQSTTGFILAVYEGDNGGNPDTSRDREFYVTVFTKEDSGMGSLPVNMPTLVATSGVMYWNCTHEAVEEGDDITSTIDWVIDSKITKHKYA